MAAHKEPASIIAAQLRHADGGALAQRVYIHQLPQTAPRLAELIEDVYGPASRNTQATSALRPAEGNQALQAAMTSYAGAAFPKLRDSVAGTGFEPVKAMPAILQVGSPSPRGSRPIPTCSRSWLLTCANGSVDSFCRHPASLPVPPRPARPGVGRRRWRESWPPCSYCSGNPTCSDLLHAIDARVVHDAVQHLTSPRYHAGGRRCRRWCRGAKRGHV